MKLDHFAALALLSVGCPAAAPEEAPKPTDTQDEEGPPEAQWDARFDPIVAQALDDLSDSGAAGVSIAIMEDGAITFAQAFGSARPDEDVTPDAETLFQIGSTTKMLTSIGLLQKVDAGELSLEMSLAEVYPDSEFGLDPTWNQEITGQHLLTHQGGFLDYFEWTSSSDDDDLADWHAKTFFPSIYLMNEPGMFWNYSNPNFSIAGLLVEHYDDRSYPDVLRDDVFSPLGMTRTYQRLDDALADGNFALGTGYTAAGSYGDVLAAQILDPAAARPAGACTWSTPTQMLAVADFLMYGDEAVLSEVSRAAITTPQVSLEYADGDAYGYGMMLSTGAYVGDAYFEVEHWEHGGNTLSYSSAFHILPEYGFAISILSSGYGTDFSPTVGVALGELLDLGAPTAPPAYPFDADNLDRRVGTYNDAYNVGDIVVTREGDALHVAMPALTGLGYTVGDALYAVSDTLFYVEIDGDWYDLTFIGEPGEDSRWVRNRSFVGTRVPSESPDAALGADRAKQVARWLKRGRLPEVPLHLPPPPRSSP